MRAKPPDPWDIVGILRRYEFRFSSEVELQRGIGEVLARNGQDESVNVYYLVADHGSDPIVVDVLGLKSEQQDGIEDPHGGFVTEMIRDDDHIERLARNYLREAIEEGVA